MFTDLKPYPDYHPRRGTWFSAPPREWSVLPMRALFNEVREAGWVDEPLLSVTINRGIVPQSDLLADTSKKDSSNRDKSKYKMVLPGEIAYNKMRAWQGAIGSSMHRGIVSPAYVVLRPRGGLSAEYSHYLLRTPAFAKEAERWSYGITSDMWSLRPEHFKLIECPIPPPEEQAAIVRYLAHANRRIDQAIAAKRRLIRLLEEQKQVIINQAVTRGLDPNVPTRDPGVPYLGEVPFHWDVRRLGSVIREGPRNGISPQVSEGGDLESFSIAAVRDGVVDVRNTDIKIVSRAAVPRIETYGLRNGDVLVVRGNGNLRLVGRAGRVIGDMPGRIYPDLLMRIRLVEGVDPSFVVTAMNSSVGRAQIELAARTAVGTHKLSGSGVRRLQFGLPSLAEQRAIVRELDAATEIHRSAISRSERELALLVEFRTRLTADAVTGQVDVRAIATTLPDVELDELVDGSDEAEDEALDDEMFEDLEEA